MAAERNVITILIQAIDRASGALRSTRRELDDLEKSEKRLAPTTAALNQEQGKLVDTSSDVTRSLDLQNEKLIQAEQHARGLAGDIDTLRRRTDDYRKSIKETDRDQLSFFDHLREFQTKQGDFFGQRQREILRDARGRILGQQAFPIADFERIPTTPQRSTDPDQLRLFNRAPQITANIERFFNLFPRLQREIDDTDSDLKNIRSSADEFFGALRRGDGVVAQLIRDFRRLRLGAQEGLDPRVISQLINNEQARLAQTRRRATTFGEVEDIDRQRRSLSLLNDELRNTRTSVEDLRRLGRVLNIPGLTDDDRRFVERLDMATRSVRRLDDAVGDNGLRGRFRALGSDMNTRLEPGFRVVNRAVERLARSFGVNSQQIDQFLTKSSRRDKQLLDITQFDETVQVGLRRLSRILVIVSAIIPFVVAGFGAITGAVTALVGGVTALAGAFSQLVGVVAALPTLLAATAGAFLAFQTVVGPGITLITDRFKEALQIQDASRKRTTEDARSTQQAQAAAAQAIQQGNEQIRDSELRLSRLRRDNAEQERDSRRELIQLKRRDAEEEADLVRDIRRAKRDAAADAREQEKQYQEIVRQNREDERDIARELSARRAALGSLLQQGADPAQIAAAQAAVRGFEQRQGREVAANRRQEADALKQVTNARTRGAENVADLERRLHRTRRDNAAQEQEAETRLARLRRTNIEQVRDAETELARQRRDAARQAQTAAENLAATQQKAASDLTDTLKGLDPVQRRIVQQLLRIRTEWLRLTEATRLGAERLGERALSFLENNLPAIARRANQFTEVITQLGNQALTRFTSPEAIGRVNRILNDALGITRQLGESTLDLGDAFLILADRARPVATHISDIVRSLSERFLKTIRASEQTGGLDQFFGRTNRVLDLTLDILGSLAKALLNVLRIGEPFGEILLGDLSDWADHVQEFTETQAPAIEDFFRDSIPVVRELGGLLSDLVVQLFKLGRDLIRPGAQGDVFLIDLIRSIREGLPGLRQFIEDVTTKNGPELLKFLRALGTFIGTLVGPNGPFITFLGILTGIFNIIDALPDGISRLILAYFAFGGIIVNVTRRFQIFLAAIAGRTAVAGTGGGTGALVAGLRGTTVGLMIAALIAFPGLIDTAVAAMRRLLDIISPVTAAMDAFGSSVGVSSDNTHEFAIQVGFLGLILGRSGIAGTVRGLAGLVRFVTLLTRAILAGGLLGGLLALETRFPRLAAALNRVQTALGGRGLLAAVGRLGFVIGGITIALDALHFAASKIDQVLGTNLRSIFLSTTQTLANFRDAWVQVAGDVGRAVTFIIREIRDHWPVAIGAALAGVPGAVLGLIGGELASFGRKIVEGIWEGIKDALPTLGGLIGAALGRILPHIDVPGFSPPREAAKEAIGRPIGEGITEGAVEGLSGFGDTLGDTLSKLIDQQQNIIDTAIDAAPRAAATRTQTALQAMQDMLATAQAKIDDFRNSVSDLESTVPAFIRAQATQTDVPARRELARLDRQETVRDRAQRRREANDELQEAQRQQRIREQSLSSAVSRLARLRARLARASTGVPGDRGPGVAPGAGIVTPLTPAQRRAIQQDIRQQQQVIAERQRELNEAEKQVREVSVRRKETFRQVALEERRERLEALAVTQEAEREKEIQAQERRAADAIQAYLKGLDTGKIPIREARRRLIRVLTGLGLDGGEVSAWLKAGSRVGNDFGTGLIASLNEISTRFPKAVNAAIQKARIQGLIQAPVVIITDVNVIRSIVTTGKPPPRDAANRLYPKATGAAGLVVPGGEGAPVPIVAHAGEWVLNRSQQLRAALMAGMDRTVLERALFHLTPTGFRTNFAWGGTVMPSQVDNLGHTFLTPVNIQTASQTVDADYVARALESRMRTVVGR